MHCDGEMAGSWTKGRDSVLVVGGGDFVHIFPGYGVRRRKEVKMVSSQPSIS